MVRLDGVCAGSLAASRSRLSCFAQLQVPSLEGLHHIVHFVSILFSALSMAISCMACAGAGVSPLGTARRLTTTGICGGGTPAGIE